MRRDMKEEEILKVIPRDRWVTAREIAARLGVSAHRVGCLIAHRLTNLVETRRFRPGWRGARNLYRRR